MAKDAKTNGKKVRKTAAKKSPRKGEGVSARVKAETVKAPAKKPVSTGPSLVPLDIMRVADPSNLIKEKIMKKETSFDKMSETFSSEGREQIEILVKSGGILMKGCEEMTKTCMEIAQESSEKSAQIIKAAMACKTVNELAEIQSRWVQQSFDDMMAGASRLTEIGIRIATDTLEPINDQMTKTMKKAAESAKAA